LNKLLREVDCPCLAACCDSGAMLMQGDDPHSVGNTMPGRIGLVRARDAVAGSAQAGGYEVTQGQGNLDPERFLASLSEATYMGDIVLTRSAGQDSAAD